MSRLRRQAGLASAAVTTLVIHGDDDEADGGADGGGADDAGDGDLSSFDGSDADLDAELARVQAELTSLKVGGSGKQFCFIFCEVVPCAGCGCAVMEMMMVMIVLGRNRAPSF